MSKTAVAIFGLIFAIDFSIGASLAKVYPHLQMHALNVGQGDAILITTPEQNHILIDGGPDGSVLNELPKVMPYMFSKIDLLILTHPHSDHVAGLVDVLDRYEVGAVLLNPVDYNSKVYGAFLEKIQGLKIYAARADEDFRFGDTDIDVLYPFESGEWNANANNQSVVLMVSQGGHKILLPGDAEKEEEAKLVGYDLGADVLKAGHHGSRTSSSVLDKIMPTIMVISSGVGNKYGHPHQETLDKAKELGVEVLRTDTEGTVSIIFDDYFWIRAIFAPSWRSFPSRFS